MLVGKGDRAELDQLPQRGRELGEPRDPASLRPPVAEHFELHNVFAVITRRRPIERDAGRPLGLFYIDMDRNHPSLLPSVAHGGWQGDTDSVLSGAVNAPRRPPVRYHSDVTRGPASAYGSGDRREAGSDGPHDLSRHRRLAGEPRADRRGARARLCAAPRL